MHTYIVQMDYSYYIKFTAVLISGVRAEYCLVQLYFNTVDVLTIRELHSSCLE